MKHGFWVIMISMMVGQLVRLPGGGVISDILVPMYLGVFIFVSREKIAVLPRYIWWWAVWLLWLLGGLFLNLSHLPFGGEITSVLYWLRLALYTGLMIPWAVWLQESRQETLKLAWNMLVSTGVLIAGLGFIQLILVPDFSFMAAYGWDPHQGRLLSTWYDPNFVGGLLGLVLLLVVARLVLLIQAGGYQWRPILWLAGITGWLGLALILTYSRSALLATIIGLLCLTFLVSRKVLGVTIVMLVLVFSLNPRLQERVQGALELDVTASLRIQSWQQTLDDIADNPWMGIGYNTTRYQQVIPESLNSSSGRDSSLLTLWMTSGLIGVVGYVALIGYKGIIWINRLHTSPLLWERIMSSGALVAWITLLSHSWFVNSLFYPHLMIPLFILLIL